ncbi:MAG: SDR family oxidoreductase [Chloroflexota bacterium]|nr:SDR family oxidoreductase [Chloroflexota bacterium]
MPRLAGKVAINSGGASGIGAATARRFVVEGAVLAILDVNTTAGRALVQELNAVGEHARFFDCDVREVGEVANAVERAAADLGGVDIVFANAGVGTVVVGGTVETIDVEHWELAFEVNARGVYALCRAAVPHMRARGGGSIVMTSSSSALVGTAGRPTHAYAATKGALVSLTRAMAVTYGPENIRVNALVPGFVRTRLTEDVMSQPGQLEAALQGIPLRRVAEPEELAACALFLASDEASFVTGATLVADGGQTVM